MSLPPTLVVWLKLFPLLGVGILDARADPNVVVSASAAPSYTAQKYAAGTPRLETYVIAQGNYFEGATVDGSIDGLPFLKILEIFAPELARRNHLPSKDMKSADLLIAVHWGVTQPRASMLEMTARTSAVSDTSNAHDDKNPAVATDFVGSMATSIVSPELDQLRFDALDQVNDQVGAELHAANAAKLLGYNKTLRKSSGEMMQSEEDRTLRHDLLHERYFIILKAYDLRKPADGPKRAVWTINLNMSSAGNNFTGALAKMSNVAVDYFGRETEGVDTIRAKPRDGRVDIGTPVIVRSEVSREKP